MLNGVFVQPCQPIAIYNISFFRFQQIKYATRTRDRDFDIDCGIILKLTDGLNLNKPHDHGEISVRMLTIGWYLFYIYALKSLKN